MDKCRPNVMQRRPKGGNKPNPKGVNIKPMKLSYGKRGK